MDTNQLIALLNRYQARTPHITWSQVNLTRNPLLLQLASSYGDDSAVNSDCLIIRCEETGRHPRAHGGGLHRAHL